jgi:CBS domain containing-hemolysin-like protein
MTVFGWLISFFDKSANLLLRALRIEPVHDLDVSASADDLPRIIADSRESGDLPVELSLMMDRMVDFPQRDVEHAMVPAVAGRLGAAPRRRSTNCASSWRARTRAIR